MWTILLAIAVLGSAAPSSAQSAGCEPEFASTFELIEKVIFENRGCTSSGCHDEAARGGLHRALSGAGFAY